MSRIAERRCPVIQRLHSSISRVCKPILYLIIYHGLFVFFLSQSLSLSHSCSAREESESRSKTLIHCLSPGTFHSSKLGVFSTIVVLPTPTRCSVRSAICPTLPAMIHNIIIVIHNVQIDDHFFYFCVSVCKFCDFISFIVLHYF